jgi:hypothetical protein
MPWRNAPGWPLPDLTPGHEPLHRILRGGAGPAGLGRFADPGVYAGWFVVIALAFNALWRYAAALAASPVSAALSVAICGALALFFALPPKAAGPG